MTNLIINLINYGPRAAFLAAMCWLCYEALIL